MKPGGHGEEEMEQKAGSLWEWVIPAAFFLCFGWFVWHIPAYILDWFPPASESLLNQVTALHLRNDMLPGLPGVFGGLMDIVDLIALAAMPVLIYLGVRTVRQSSIEFTSWRPIDKVSVFIGRVTMMMIVALTSVMLYEVFVRYVLERPTIWPNELTLWIAGFVFLLAGLYAMQQRSHIRIVLLYDAVPRNVQRVFDTISVVLTCVFAFALVFGSYKQVFVNKLYKWETFGTAFDPPIPATLQPMVLIVITLVALQAIINLISDWNADPADLMPDEIEDEVETLKKTLGAD